MAQPQTLRLVEFDRYALRTTNSNISNTESIFGKQAWPVFRASISRTPQLDLLNQNPWLQPLASSSGILDETIAILDQGYNQPTLAMLELDTLSSNFYVAAIFRSRLIAKLTANKVAILLAQDELPPDASNEFSKACSIFQEILRPLLHGDPLETPAAGPLAAFTVEGIGSVSNEARQARQYRLVFARRVEELCLAVGVPETVVNPRANIYALRKFLSSRPQVSLARETSLQLQVDELTERTRWQGRVITNLIYRHLMEQLPEGGPADHRQRWSAFFEQAVQNAQQAQPEAGQTSSHPLAAALRGSESSTSRDQFMRLGRELYDSIDSNVRASNIEYRPANDQWDAVPLVLLQALKPVSYRGNGEVNWEAERQRFLSPSSSTELTTRERRSEATESIPVTSLSEANRPPPYSAA